MPSPQPPRPLDRRRFLEALALVLGAGGAPGARAQGAPPAGPDLGPPRPFTFDALVERARAAAAAPFVPVPAPSPEVLARIDYDAHGRLRYDPDRALFAPGSALARRHPVTFFHLGRYFQRPQRAHVVGGGQAREVLYGEGLFDAPADSPARALPRGAGFAGFRLQEAVDGPLDWRRNDWVAFLGASYFRAIGTLNQYGLSARAVAIDAGDGTRPEEFPDFTEVFIEQPADQDGVIVSALLDGPSLSGAFRFLMRRAGGVVMDVDARLFIRRDVNRLSLAPLTSMYWYSEANPSRADWRPEVHDSDGLSLATGLGERVWRPLNNPSRATASVFLDENPRGFGLLQRDRAFDHYQDGVHYERRPSLWVEPLSAWGRGAVELIELPTDDEIHDNVIAAWRPEAPARAGDALALRYRLHWLADEPYPTNLARVVATRAGNGGRPGQPRPGGVRKFLVEFVGEPLRSLAFGERPEAVLSASRGAFSYVFTEAVPNDVPGHWRAQFDHSAEGSEPVEMRLFLRAGGRTLSETWAHQHRPAG